MQSYLFHILGLGCIINKQFCRCAEDKHTNFCSDKHVSFGWERRTREPYGIVSSLKVVIHEFILPDLRQKRLLVALLNAL